MSLDRKIDSVTTRAQFPLMLEFDSLGQSHHELGLSPAWLACFVNSRDAPNTSEESRFAPYTATEEDRHQSATRLGMQRPFAMSSMGAQAFFNEGGSRNKAAYLEARAALLEQKKFMAELGTEVGLHMCFLFHCLDVNKMYHDQKTDGRVGEGDAHKRPGSTLYRTPYEAYYEELKTHFDLDNLNLRPEENHKLTLGDLAQAALALFSPVAFSNQHTDSWTLSPDLLVDMEGWIQGTSMCPWGTLSDDGDGNQRYVIQPPSDLLAGESENSGNQGVLRNAPDLFDVVDRSAPEYDHTDPAFNAKIGRIAIDSVDTPGTHAMYAAMRAVGLESWNSHYNGANATGTKMGFKPATGDSVCWRSSSSRALGPDTRELPGIVGDIEAGATTLRAWTLPTHQLVELVRTCSRMVTPLYMQLGTPLLRDVKAPGVLQFTRYDHAEIVDLVNLYSTFRIQYNPIDQIKANNGPFDPDMTPSDLERYWKPDYTSITRKFIKDKLADVFFDLSVPSGIGEDEALVSDWFASLPPQIAMGYFNFDPSSLRKRRRSLVIPAGRNAGSNVISSATQDPARHLALPLAMVFGTFRFRTLHPFSDIDYTVSSHKHTASLASVNNTVVNSSDLGQAIVYGKTKATNASEVVEIGIEKSANSTSIGTAVPLQFSDDLDIPARGRWGRILSAAGIAASNPFRSISSDQYVPGNLFTAAGAGWELLSITEPPSYNRNKYDKYDTTAVLSPTPNTAGTPHEVEVELLKECNIIGGRVVGATLPMDIVTDANALVAALPPVSGNQPDLFNAANSPDDATFVTNLVATFPNVSSFCMQLVKVKLLNGVAYGGASEATALCIGMDVVCKGLDLQHQNTANNRRVFMDHQPGDTSPKYHRENSTGTGIILSNDVELAAAIVSVVTNRRILADAQIGTNAGETTVHNALLLRSVPYPLGVGTHSTTTMQEYLSLIPNKLNIKITPELTLFDAAVANYSGMRLYPRALADRAEFAGLPYFGEPQPFMRKIVETENPELVQLDRVTENPFLDPTGRLLHLVNETYVQTGYSHGMLALKALAGEMYCNNLDVDTILAVQDTLVRRGQMG